MYRKNLESMAVEVENNGFLNRLAEFPMSKVAMEQVSFLYEHAHHQKLLGMGLTAGEITFRLAGKVASPVISKLPVDTIDSMACKQLDLLEHMVPGIKKEPKELLAASEELYNKAKAVPSTTVQVVRDAGINTVTGVTTYAIETISPTVERVGKVKSYSVEKMSSATTYTKDKLEGVKATYEGVKSGEVVYNCYNSMKSGVIHQYEGIKGGVVDRYDGAVATVSGMKTGLVDGYVKAKNELLNYTNQTFEPTVQRYTTVKTYGMEKLNTPFVTNSYTGLKNMTASVMDSVSHNGMVQSVGHSVNGMIDYASNQLDYYLPRPMDTDELEINPASPEAGTWTRTMILMTSLRGRIYTLGQQRMKPLTIQAEDMVASLTSYKDSTSQTLSSYYHYSQEHLTKVYNSSTEYITGPYHNGLDFVNNTYKASQDRYNGVKETAKGTYEYVGGCLVSIKEGTYTSVHKLSTNFHNTTDYVTGLWVQSTEKATSMYGYISENISFGQDYIMGLIGKNKIKEE